MSTRRPKSVLDQDRYTAELSTGQLVIGVCILLMFGLGCFLLGVLIGKFDPTLKNGQGATVASTQDPADKPEVKVAEVTVSPAPAYSPAPSAQSSQPPEMRVPPRILNETPGAPVQAEQSNETPPAVTDTVAPSPATSASLDTQVGESVSAAIEKNRVVPPGATPQAVDASAAKPQPEAIPAPETPKTTAPATAAASGQSTDGAWKGFGVQVVAVAKDRADAARKNLESKSSYKARVLPHARNSLFRVVVGPFPDQASAGRARDELRSRFGYKDAFVLTLQ